MFPDLMRDDVFRLETARLWLRWPRQSDARAVADIACAKEAADLSASIPHLAPRGDADGFVLSARGDNMQGARLTLAITPKARPNVLIGMVGVAPAQTPGEGELGYWIGAPWRGSGFTTEAVQALIGASFDLAGLEAITAAVEVGNPAARRVLEKCGFSPDGERVREDSRFAVLRLARTASGIVPSAIVPVPAGALGTAATVTTAEPPLAAE
ncbi:MAG: GNAT family N-acetyltransferase [Microvirga sp.]|nr:GNAT family N-acetyltransferase [Microvirga sp.]